MKPAEERPLAERIAGRSFPSVFQAWNRADNLKDEDPLITMARHDLAWLGPRTLGLVWDKSPEGLAEGFTPESIQTGRDLRRKLLGLNPNMVLIAEIRYRDAHGSFLPDDSKWWARDAKGARKAGWEEGKYFLLDFQSAEFREHVARQAKAVVECGVFDGVMLDWWADDGDRLALAKAVRGAIGEKALIVANANDRKTPKTAQFINGYFMECYRSRTAEEWKRIAETLSWAEANLREPRVNCVETWFHKSRQDLDLMRSVTCLALTLSDGYCLFSDPNELPTPDHLHDWYPFWNRSLGKPKAKGVGREDGAYAREFDTGAAVYNPMGNKTVVVVFPEDRTSLATGKRARNHELAEADGDIYLRDYE